MFCVGPVRICFLCLPAEGFWKTIILNYQIETWYSWVTLKSMMQKFHSLTLSITKHNKNDPLIIEMVLGFSVLWLWQFFRSLFGFYCHNSFFFFSFGVYCGFHCIVVLTFFPKKAVEFPLQFLFEHFLLSWKCFLEHRLTLNLLQL